MGENEWKFLPACAMPQGNWYDHIHWKWPNSKMAKLEVTKLELVREKSSAVISVVPSCSLQNHRGGNRGRAPAVDRYPRTFGGMRVQIRAKLICLQVEQVLDPHQVRTMAF